MRLKKIRVDYANCMEKQYHVQIHIICLSISIFLILPLLYVPYKIFNLVYSLICCYSTEFKLHELPSNKLDGCRYHPSLLIRIYTFRTVKINLNYHFYDRRGAHKKSSINSEHHHHRFVVLHKISQPPALFYLNFHLTPIPPAPPLPIPSTDSCTQQQFIFYLNFRLNSNGI